MDNKRTQVATGYKEVRRDNRDERRPHGTTIQKQKRQIGREEGRRGRENERKISTVTLYLSFYVELWIVFLQMQKCICPESLCHI